MQQSGMGGSFFYIWAGFQAFMGTASLVAAFYCSKLIARPYYKGFVNYARLGVQTFSLIGLVWLAGAVTNSLGSILVLQDRQEKAVLAATTVGAAAIWAAWQAWRFRARRRTATRPSKLSDPARYI
ncbi:MAG: hypothetical protein H0X37_19100 [Herpetosiphonaceae bacterium]|nr:hypothetical protein [Herpetosiphonaceae bacterium]